MNCIVPIFLFIRLYAKTFTQYSQYTQYLMYRDAINPSENMLSESIHQYYYYYNILFTVNYFLPANSNFFFRDCYCYYYCPKFIVNWSSTLYMYS